MSRPDLEQLLRDLPTRGTLLKDRGYRQVWRFEYHGSAYYLKFYPRLGGRLKRLLRGSPAMREFLRLQWLQKAQVPAPRPVGVLMGYRLNGVIGDAVIMDAIEPSVTLDRYLTDLALQGRQVPDRRSLARQMIELLHALGAAGLSHADLHLGNFLLSGGKLYLLDAYEVRRGGLRSKDLMLLHDSARTFMSRTDLARAWEVLGTGWMPRRNPVSRHIWRKFLGRIFDGNRHFGHLGAGEWSGVFFKQMKYPRRWAPASSLHVQSADWQQAWGNLLEDVQHDRLTALKRSSSGDVLAGQVTLGGKTVDVILKRPRRKYWWRYLNEIGRGGRARRAWHKSWSLVVRDIPTAWPLLLVEKRRFGYVTDAIIVYERIAGSPLAEMNLDTLSREQRWTLFRRVGNLLRQLESSGRYHWDAKASNWMVTSDPLRGPVPLLVDVDGIRWNWGRGEGMRRLLESMKEHRQYTPEDSLALCRGYAPFARVRRES